MALFSLLLACEKSTDPKGGGGNGGGNPDPLVAATCVRAQFPTALTATAAAEENSPSITDLDTYYRIQLQPSQTQAGYLGFVKWNGVSPGTFRLFLAPDNLTFGMARQVDSVTFIPVQYDSAAYPKTCPDTVAAVFTFKIEGGNHWLQFGTTPHSHIGLLVSKP
jgi:hypothetical protein